VATEHSEARRPRVHAPAKREAEVLEVAAGVFHRHGYSDTAVQDIADALGIRKASLYHYIDSKDDLLYRICRQVHEDARDMLAKVDATPGSALERIAAYVRLHVDFNLQHLTKIAVYWHDFDRLSPARRELLRGRRRDHEMHVRSLIEAGKRDGSIDPGVDTRIAARGIAAQTIWIYTWYEPDGKIDPEDLAGSIVQLVVKGLSVPAPAPGC
jgi:AcrR family transcriptional regulator